MVGQRRTTGAALSLAADRADASNMDDSFELGAPARRPARLRPVPATRPQRPGRAAAGIAVAVVALIAGGFAVLRVVASGGEQASDAARTAVGQIGVAQDLAAQETARRATFAAMAARAQDGAFPTAEALAAQDPSLGATSGVSTGPNVSSVAVTERGFAVAVASGSGSCLWSRVDPEGVVTYGSGQPCTGEAAMAAAAPAW
jgi:hypothetical protein